MNIEEQPAFEEIGSENHETNSQQSQDLPPEKTFDLIHKEIREDVSSIKPFDKYVKINSEIIFENKHSTDALIVKEANEIFVSRKDRHALLDQILHKVRWRYTRENKMESNARMARWSDGSYGIYIGSEYFEIQGAATGNEMLYSAQDNLLMLQHQINYSGKIQKKREMRIF